MNVSTIFSTRITRRGTSLDWKRVFQQTDCLLAAVKDDMEAGKTKESTETAIEWLLTFDRKFSEDVFSEYDEEGWMVAMACKDLADIIESAIVSPSTSNEARQVILHDIETLSGCRIYDDYGFLDIKNFIKRIKTHNATGDEALPQLDELIQHERHVGEYDSKLHELVFRKASILRSQGKDEEAEQAILDDIRNVKVCTQYVSELVEKKEYSKAIRVLDLAISQLDNYNWSGESCLVKQKLEIYKTIGNEESVIKTFRELFKNSFGKFEYYKELKARIPAAEWKGDLAQLMSETNFGVMGFCDDSNSKAEIYLAENDLQGLVDYMKHADDSIIDLCRVYVPRLPDDLVAEVIPYYVKAVRKEAERANKSSQYERIAKYIRTLSRWTGGKAPAIDLVYELLSMYPHRPAMRRALANL